MSDRTLIILLIAAIALPVAYIMDRNRPRKLSLDELDRQARSPEWKKQYPALKELKRRGQDLAPYLPAVLPHLASASSFDRSAGWLTLKDYFPAVAAEIPKFGATSPAAQREALVAPLLARYGAGKPPAAETKT